MSSRRTFFRHAGAAQGIEQPAHVHVDVFHHHDCAIDDQAEIHCAQAHEIGADLGVIGLVAGATVTIFEDNRTYLMARAQSPGNVAVYGGFGVAWVANQHTDSFSIGNFNPGDTVTYTEENQYLMFEGGVKGQWGLFTARAFVGADLEISTNCIASEGDCDHTPYYAGISTGISLH